MASFMAAMMFISLLPSAVFATGTGEGSGETITAVGLGEQPAEYTVGKGTALESVGLPSSVAVTFAASDETDSVREDVEEVTWSGSYDGNIVGVYSLTAAFVDETLSFADMPKVTVNVTETAEPTQVEEKPESVNEQPAQVETPTTLGASPRAGAETLTITNPRLTVDSLDPLGDIVKSYSTKGLYARIHTQSTASEGVTNVWLGYRFTLTVPEGKRKEDAQFTAVSYNWLMNLTDGTKTATPTWDETSRTWTLEGKFFYKEPVGLGSGKSSLDHYITFICCRFGRHSNT